MNDWWMGKKMDKFSYIIELEDCLMGIDEQKRNQILHFYDQYLTESDASSRTDCVKLLGTPRQLASRIFADLAFKGQEDFRPLGFQRTAKAAKTLFLATKAVMYTGNGGWLTRLTQASKLFFGLILLVLFQAILLLVGIEFAVVTLTLAYAAVGLFFGEPASGLFYLGLAGVAATVTALWMDKERQVIERLSGWVTKRAKVVFDRQVIEEGGDGDE